MERISHPQDETQTAGSGPGLAEFWLTRQLFYGIAVSCVLGLGLGFWAKPPAAEASPQAEEPMAVASQYGPDGPDGAGQRSSYWQVARADATAYEPASVEQ